MPSNVPRCAAVLTQHQRQQQQRQQQRSTATCLACGVAHFVALSQSLSASLSLSLTPLKPGGAPNLPYTMLPACLNQPQPQLTSPGLVACCMTQVQVGRMTFSALTHKIKSNGGIYKNSSNTSQTRTAREAGSCQRVEAKRGIRATCGTFIKNAIRSMCYMKHKV